jgi:hypothetical protein
MLTSADQTKRSTPVRQVRFTKNKALTHTSAALAITAGGGCGYNCRVERTEETLERVETLIERNYQKKLKACGEDEECQDKALDQYLENLDQLLDWYLVRIDNDHKKTQDDENKLKEILDGIGDKLIKTLAGYTGTVTGAAQIFETTAVIVSREQISVNSTEPEEADTGGVSTSTEDPNLAVTGVASATVQSGGSPIPANLLRTLDGSFTLSALTSQTFAVGQYTFSFSFAIGSDRTLNGLTTRRINAGTAIISSTNLTFVLDSDVGQSQLIMGNTGRGVIRLAGRLVAADESSSVPFDGFLKFDLPVREDVTGALIIETDGIVDLNIFADVLHPEYLDYDENGVINNADRTAFIADLNAGVAWTDLNADGVLDALDTVRFDQETAAAQARSQFLLDQGVNQ